MPRTNGPTGANDMPPARLSISAIATTPPARLSLTATAVISLEAAKAEGEAPLPRFKMVANTGIPMRLAGWRHPVIMDLAGLKIPSQELPVRHNHDSGQGVGHTESVGVRAGEDGNGDELVASGVVSRDTEAAREVVASAKQKFPWQASIGASSDEVQFVKEGEQATVNGRQYSGPLNVVRKSVLGEISFVDRGADGSTSVRVAAADDPQAGAGAGRDALDGADAASQSIARAKADRKREDGIAALVAEHISYRGSDIAKIESIQDKALAEHWTVQETELALLRETRPRAPAPSRAPKVTPKVLEAALCIATGISDEVLAKDREYGPDVVQQAWPLRHRGLRGTIAAALESAGIRPPHGSRELFDAILDAQRVNAAGFSEINLPGILGNVANKVLLTAFTEVDATYDRIAELADYTNFYTHSIYRLGVNGEFEKVAPDGQLKHATLGQDSYTNKLDTYGKLLTLSRQDIYNDDLNAFRSLVAQLARKARIAVERALYALVMESIDAYYTTARGNRLTGALGISALAAGEAAMRLQTDADGDPIYASPTIILVPPGLKYFADVLNSSALVGAVTTSQLPSENPFRGRFRPESSPFLANSSLAGYSATTWYLLADPRVLPAFQVAFLDGRRAPTIETADAVFSTLGISWRAYWDFGVAQLDYRGAVKSTAA